jgi:hypothetical protein
VSGWWAIAAAALVALPILLFIGDFLLLAARGLLVRLIEGSEADPLPVSEAWYLTLYKWRRTPRIRLTGVRADPELIYDGRMVAAVASWWNALLEKRPAFRTVAGARPVTVEGVQELQSLLAPENRTLVAAKARSLAPFDTLAEACFGLAYSFACVFGGGSDTEMPSGPQVVTGDDLTATDQNYGDIGSLLISDLADVPQEGWWKEIEVRGLWNKLTLDAIRWTYSDQVRRWEDAEGRKMGKGIGFSFPDSGRLVDEFADLLFEHGGRFMEAQRLVSAEWSEEGSPEEGP